MKLKTHIERYKEYCKIHFSLRLPDSGIRPEIYEGVHTRVAQGNQQKNSVDVAEDMTKKLFSYFIYFTREHDLKSILKRTKTTQQIFSRKKGFPVKLFKHCIEEFS